MSKQALHEILSTRMWDFLPAALHGYKSTLEKNIGEHIRVEFDKATRPDRPYVLSSAASFTEKTYIGNGGGVDFSELEREDRFINVLPVEGAILRNGGACSYGSKEHRDIIMRAADDSRTLGHLLLIDGPGGSAYAKFDYEQATNYARSKGQPIIGLIDGMACSAHYAAAALCDEVYFVNPHDIIGSIGTMAAFYTNKDGDTNTVTQERYVEVYATGSPEKNKEHRDAAEGDYKQLQAEVDALCADYHAMVREHRPSVTDEQLKGATYKAADVIGTMVDGQGTLQTCIERILALSGQRQATPSASRRAGENGSEIINQNSTEMKEYPKLNAAAGMSLASDKSNGVYLNEELADAVESTLAANEHLQGTLDAKMADIAQLNETVQKGAAALDAANTAHEEAIAQLKAEHEAALVAANEAHVQALADQQKQHEAAMQEADAAHQDELTALSNQLGEAQNALAEKEAELKELGETAPQEPAAGEAPKDNTVQGKQEAGSGNIFKSGMTLEEKVAAMKERDKKLKNALR